MSEVRTPSSGSSQSSIEDLTHPGSPREDPTHHAALPDQALQASIPRNEQENGKGSVEVSDSEDSETNSRAEDGTAISAAEMRKKLEQMTSDRPTSHDLEQFLKDFRPLWTQGTKSTEDYLITPLHLIAREPQFSCELIPRIVQAEPDMMLATNMLNKSAIHIAIERKNYPALTNMLDNYGNIDEVLRLKDASGSNCLHLAFAVGLKRRYILSLIKRASELTICAQDDGGRTPLHLAVHYRLCTPSQAIIVQELLNRGDNALDCFDKNGHSVYQYHENTVPQRTQKREDGSIKVDHFQTEINQDSVIRRVQVAGQSDLLKRNDKKPTDVDRADTDANSSKKIEAAAHISYILKTHYLRSIPSEFTRTLSRPSGIDRTQSCARRFFFSHISGPTPTFLFVPPPTTSPVREDDFRQACETIKFFDVMRLVQLPAKFEILPFSKDPVENLRRDLEIPFIWLRDIARVRKIIKVVADDPENEPHSDEVIEEALKSFDVEELDWKKKDICPRTLRRIGDHLRVLDLYWGGNNAVLRAWSEPDGLPRLSKLEVVRVRVVKTLEYERRVVNDLQEFTSRIRALRPSLHVSYTLPQVVAISGISVGRKSDSDVPKNQVYRWFSMMFDFLNDVSPSLRSINSRKPSIAIIDTAVNIFDKDLMGRIGSLDNIAGIESFSADLHGTYMAKAIIRIAQESIDPLIVLQADFSSPSQLAEAIREAVARQVDIICMAWCWSGKKEDVVYFKKALLEASKRGIVMFCLPSEGNRGSSEQPVCPANLDVPGLYRVGAVVADEWPSAEVRQRQNLDLVLPALMPSLYPSEPSSLEIQGSVAPAIACGLAAILLHFWSSKKDINRFPGIPVPWKVSGKQDLIRKFVSYLARRQNELQNLSVKAGWEPFQNKDAPSLSQLVAIHNKFANTYFSEEIG